MCALLTAGSHAANRDDDAVAFVKQLFVGKIATCNSHIYMLTLYGRLGQLHEPPKFLVWAEPVTKADQLNGIDYVATVRPAVDVFRMFDTKSRTWAEWKSPGPGSFDDDFGFSRVDSGKPGALFAYVVHTNAHWELRVDGVKDTPSLDCTTVAEIQNKKRPE